MSNSPKRDQEDQCDDPGTSGNIPCNRSEHVVHVTPPLDQNGDRTTATTCVQRSRHLAVEPPPPPPAGSTQAKKASLANAEIQASDQDRPPFTDTTISPTERDVSMQQSSSNNDCSQLREHEPGSLLHYSCSHRDSASRELNSVTAADDGATSSVSGNSGNDKDDRPDTETSDSETSDEDHHRERRKDYREEDRDRDSNASDEDFDIAFIRQPRRRVKTFGIPLLFKKTDDSPPALPEVCLTCVEQHIAFAAQESPLTVTATRRGYLRVTVQTTIAASYLQVRHDKYFAKKKGQRKDTHSLSPADLKRDVCTSIIRFVPHYAHMFSVTSAAMNFTGACGC